MQVRLRRVAIGETVTVKDSEMHFHLPEGLPDGAEAVCVGRESGRYIVQALGREWNIAMQSVRHVEEVLVNGVWLERYDRRAMKARLNELGFRPMPRRGM